MTPEQVARRYERKSGYDLIDYAPVALPLYRLSIDAVTMFHRSIPPIKEFVLRSIGVGLSLEKQIAGFLGLDNTTVRAALELNLRDRYIDEQEDGRFVLSPRGIQVLLNARESSPRDEMLVFLYDRLLQRPVRLVGDDLLVPSGIDAKRMIEIRPYPADGPELKQLSIPDISFILHEQAGGSVEFGRDLLRLKRIAKRTRMFRPAIVLVFKKRRSSDIVAEFVVDDVKDEALSHVFAERGGTKKMGFLKSIDESATSGA